MSQYIHAFDSANKVVKPVNVDSNGNLQVDIVSSDAGGDATAAHQVTNHGKLDVLEASLTSMEGKQDTQVTHLSTLAGTVGSAKVNVNISSGTVTANLSATDNAVLDEIAADGDNIQTKLDTLDGSVNVIEACVTSNELAVSHGALTELAAAINSNKVDVNLASFTTGQATMASSLPVTLASNQSAVGVTHAAFTEIENAINSNKMDVNIASPLGQTTAASSIPVTLASNQPSIAVTNAAVEPTLSQATLASGASITAGSSTSEIDMNGFKHLTIYGTSSVNFGSFILCRRATSGGGNILDASAMMSASDPTGGSNYHFSATFKDVGNRYVAFQNTSSGSQIVTLYAVKHR